MNQLTFKAADANGTSLRGYLDNVPLPFTSIVARLKTLSGQEPAEGGDAYKVSVEFKGTFNGHVFTLYDYKGDDTIHIGGHGGLDVDGLKSELAERLRVTQPSPYEARRHYDGSRGTRHGWGEV